MYQSCLSCSFLICFLKATFYSSFYMCTSSLFKCFSVVVLLSFQHCIFFKLNFIVSAEQSGHVLTGQTHSCLASIWVSFIVVQVSRCCGQWQNMSDHDNCKDLDLNSYIFYFVFVLKAVFKLLKKKTQSPQLLCCWQLKKPLAAVPSHLPDLTASKAQAQVQKLVPGGGIRQMSSEYSVVFLLH